MTLRCGEGDTANVSSLTRMTLRVTSIRTMEGAGDQYSARTMEDRWPSEIDEDQGDAPGQTPLTEARLDQRKCRGLARRPGREVPG